MGVKLTPLERQALDRQKINLASKFALATVLAGVLTLSAKYGPDIVEEAKDYGQKITHTMAKADEAVRQFIENNHNRSGP